jgi:hypothetical protein
VNLGPIREEYQAYIRAIHMPPIKSIPKIRKEPRSERPLLHRRSLKMILFVYL